MPGISRDIHGGYRLGLQAWNGVPTTSISLSRAAATVSTTPIEFITGGAAVTPLIVCDTAFAANNNADADFVPAATRVSATSGYLNYGGVLLNAQAGAAANIANLTLESLMVTLAHEIGHVLGLGHSSSSPALMYYSITGKVVPVISQDDMDGLTYLYPRQEFLVGAFGCGAVAAGNGRANPFGPLPLILVVLVALIARLFRASKPERLLSPREPLP